MDAHCVNIRLLRIDNNKSRVFHTVMAEALAGVVIWALALTTSSRSAAARQGTSQSVRSSLAWCIDPDDVQVAEVDALLIHPVVAGAPLGSDAVRSRES